MGWSNLAQCLSVALVSLFCDNKGVKSSFQEKELSHKCDTSATFVKLFVATAATVYQQPHFWRTEGQELCISVWLNFFHVWIHCNALSNLMQEIQFLEFMGGSTEHMPTQIFNLHKYGTVCNNTYSKTSSVAVDETHTSLSIIRQALILCILISMQSFSFGMVVCCLVN